MALMNLPKQILKASKAVSDANNEVGMVRVGLKFAGKSVPPAINDYHHILMAIKFELDFLSLEIEHGEGCACLMCVQAKERAKAIKVVVSL